MKDIARDMLAMKNARPTTTIIVIFVFLHLFVGWPDFSLVLAVLIALAASIWATLLTAARKGYNSMHRIIRDGGWKLLLLVFLGTATCVFWGVLLLIIWLFNLWPDDPSLYFAAPEAN